MDQKNKVKDLMDFVFPQQVQIPMRPEEGNEIPQMEGLVPQAAPIVQQPIEDYDAMLEADAVDKSMNTPPDLTSQSKVSSGMKSSSQSSSPSLPPQAPPEDDYRKKFLQQLEDARLQNQSNIEGGRDADNRVSLLNNMNKAFSQIGTGVANQAGYTKLTSNPLEVSSNKAGEAGMDNKSKLEALSQAYGVNKDGENAALARDKMKMDGEDRKFDRSYKQQMLDLQKFKDKGEKKEKDNVGQKELDKAAAKEYQEWTSGGAKIAQSEINKLKESLSDLKSKKVTTGGLTGLFPDQMTSNEVLNARSNIQSSIMGSLRALLGAQFTEKEGARVIKNTWNEADSTENNIERVNRLVGDLENKSLDKSDKAKYFQDNASTLKGFEVKTQKAPTSDSNMVKVIDPSGNIRSIPKNKLQQALSAGGKLAE